METNIIYNKDCIAGMAKLSKKSINLILSDLPYGTSACYWDKELDLKKLWAQYRRIITDKGAIVLFGVEPFSSGIRSFNADLYKYDWVFEKSNGANFLNSKFQPLKVHENIMVFSKSAASFSKNENMVYNPQMSEGEPYRISGGDRKFERNNVSIRSKINRPSSDNPGTLYPRSVLRFPPDKVKYHPTQKPVALIEYLIRTYSNDGNLVLDSCMGSGTTAVACINTNRTYIGFETDSTYFNISIERIKNLKSK